MSQHPAEVPDADWAEQHVADAGEDAVEVTSVADLDADPADRIDQTTEVGDDEDDDYARD